VPAWRFSLRHRRTEGQGDGGWIVTGAVGILLALVAGWMVLNRQWMAVVVIVPFLGIVGVRTWLIAAGSRHGNPAWHSVLTSGAMIHRSRSVAPWPGPLGIGPLAVFLVVFGVQSRCERVRTAEHKSEPHHVISTSVRWDNERSSR
jgi:hypothetical protein